MIRTSLMGKTSITCVGRLSYYNYRIQNDMDMQYIMTCCKQVIRLNQERIKTGDLSNYIKFETGRNFPPVLKIATHTSHAT